MSLFPIYQSCIAIIHTTFYLGNLQVHDGNNGYAPVVANLCGKEAIKPITTSGKAVYLHFTTDDAITGRGFNISWESKCL